MILLDTVAEMGIYRIALILKYSINILFTVLPLLVIILASIDIFKLVINPNEVSKTFRQVVMRIISALIVLLVPTIINYSFTLIEDYDNTVVLKYYNNASIEKIEELEKQYQEELEEKKSKEKAEYKEAYLKEQEELRKQREQIEEIRKQQEEEQQQQQSQGSYSGDTTPGGNYGSVTVQNGSFTIPNRRATSDADTPKQSGQYGLNPVFWERLSKLINDAAAQGHRITVTSGWRSYSSQRRLWDQSTRPCSERGKWVACPGGSRHGWGIAADLAFNGTGCGNSTWNCNAAAKWAHDNAANYGLKFRMSWEPWHIEPSGISGGHYGSCTATC